MSELIRVLLADDHPLLRDGVARSLDRSYGFDVVGEASSGEEAVKLARQLSPDVALLDIGMGGGGGLVAARDIVAACPDTRVAMLTVSEDEEDLLTAFKVGVRGYILKGISARDLRKIVQDLAAGEAYVSPALAADMLLDFSRPRTRQQRDPVEDLTPREQQILELLGEGLTNREIAGRLFVSEKTVKHHMTSVLQKLQVRNRVEAALLAKSRRGRRI
jgi:two-component system, NarL family, nitrate/nitrite response regulator NarL